MTAAPKPADPIDPRAYATADERLLFILSHGFCYAPGCRVPAVTRQPGKATTSVYIAHIYAAKPGGPRYDPAMSNDERRSFANLLLLCKVHHEDVDGTRAHQYPARILLQWKHDREGDLGERMAGLSQLTEPMLKACIDEALTRSAAEVRGAIDQLAVINAEAAALLRETTDRLLDVPVLDDDTVAMLSGAADGLRHLEDHAGLLYTAAQDLSHLQDHTAPLLEAADKLKHWEEHSILLLEAADTLGNPDNHASLIQALTDFNRNRETWTYQLNQAAENIDQAVMRAGQTDLTSEVSRSIAGLVGIRAEIEAKPDWMHSVDDLVAAFDFREKLRWFGRGMLTAAIPLILAALITYILQPSWL
ncbi:hypothetical protein [Longispora albida]|uniref:hypothetical protein n=1 Tax=Longispora albida TaxID=203523 RepID=UPI00036D0962|nr:hypothetical protein [Longispora albida]